MRKVHRRSVMRSGWAPVMMLGRRQRPGGARHVHDQANGGAHAPQAITREKIPAQQGTALAPRAGGRGAAAGVDITTVEGQSFTGKVVDIGSCSLASATISWGDGATSAGTSDGGTGIQGHHTYAQG